MSTPPAGATTPSLQGLALGGSPDLLTVATIDGKYVFVSDASLALFGWLPSNLLGASDRTLVYPDDIGLVDLAHRKVMGGADVVRAVCRFRCADGSHRLTEVLLRLVWDGDQQLVVSSVRPIADRDEVLLDLQRQATTDPLTGIANRTVLMDRFDQALRRLDRSDDLVAVLFLDLDRFKQINDSYGHEAGDVVLVAVAEHVRTLLRPQDTLARLGGDEFAIILEDIHSLGEALAVATRIIECGHIPFPVQGAELTCTASIGIAVTGDSRRNVGELLREADLALYRAKDRGRDRATVFDESMRLGTIRKGRRRRTRRPSVGGPIA